MRPLCQAKQRLWLRQHVYTEHNRPEQSTSCHTAPRDRDVCGWSLLVELTHCQPSPNDEQNQEASQRTLEQSAVQFWLHANLLGHDERSANGPSHLQGHQWDQRLHPSRYEAVSMAIAHENTSSHQADMNETPILISISNCLWRCVRSRIWIIDISHLRIGEFIMLSSCCRIVGYSTDSGWATWWKVARDIASSGAGGGSTRTSITMLIPWSAGSISTGSRSTRPDRAIHRRCSRNGSTRRSATARLPESQSGEDTASWMRCVWWSSKNLFVKTTPTVSGRKPWERRTCATHCWESARGGVGVTTVKCKGSPPARASNQARRICHPANNDQHCRAGLCENGHIAWDGCDANTTFQCRSLCFHQQLLAWHVSTSQRLSMS